ncbi:MAG: vWA domain-containing protein [Planctomycetota bacterium]|jgi:Mg-chelatase subunit ChlD
MDFSFPWISLLATPAAAVLIGAWAATVRGRRRGSRLRLVLSSSAALLLALGAAEPLFRSGGRPRALIFVDRSASLRSVRPTTVSAARAVERALSARFDVGFAAFASSARSLDAEDLEELVDDEAGTDLGPVFDLAAARLRPGEPAVVITDGVITARGARRAAARWGKGSPALVFLPLGPVDPDAALTALDAPARVRPGQRFAVLVTVEGSASSPVEVKLRRGVRGGAETSLGTRRVTLPAGVRERRLVRYIDTAPERGVLEYSAVLGAAGDAEGGNNAARSYTTVTGRLRALVIGSGAAVGHLRGAGLDAEELPPEKLPADLSAWDALFIENVPRARIGAAAERALVDYVRGGGGLVAVGGPDSCGSGGYSNGGRLESVLPASMVPPDEKGLFTVLLLDRSGSMGEEAAGGRRKLDVVRSAAKEILGAGTFEPGDLLTVVAFESRAAEIAPASRPADEGAAAKIRAALDGLVVGGSTDLVAALQKALEVLGAAPDPKAPRHAILLSDGLPVGPGGSGGRRKQRGQLLELAGRIAAGGATLSTVGTGSRSEDADLLRALAARGRGRFYVPPDLSALAGIFRRDLSRKRAEIASGRFRPVRTGRAMAGLPDELPELKARNRVSAKPAAWVALEAPASGGRGREPLLLAWERGRGRAVCFASDAGSSWNRGAISARAGRELFGALAHWAAGRSSREGCRLELSPAGPGRFRLELVARDSRGSPLSALSPVARAPGSAGEVALLQESPSRYAAELDAPAGETGLAVSASDPEAGELASAVFPVPYPPELSRVGVDREFLEEVAALAGGRVVSSPLALNRMAFPGAETRGRSPVAPWLALAAVLLIIAELAMRAFGR